MWAESAWSSPLRRSRSLGVGRLGAQAIHAQVVSIVPDGDRVRVQVGRSPAEVTAAAARELELAPGVTVVASFKATGARLVPLAGSAQNDAPRTPLAIKPRTTTATTTR